jgi:predicted transcriptional regulator
MHEVKRDFFGGSLKSMFSYFVQEEKLTEAEIMELLEMVKEEE